jgi:DNA-binding NtrC family response regulator
VADILRQAGHTVDGLSSAAEALDALANENYDVIITDLQMPGMTGLQFIRRLESIRHGAQILMVTAYASVTSAVDAMRHGAFDYIEKPFGVEQLEQLVERALLHGRALDGQRKLGGGEGAMPVSMIGSSTQIEALKSQIERIAATGETVLIAGESGTGKELVARMIHALSRRADAPLVSLNCPVLSAHLMESELFGHERGAFTGADAARVGRFELADGGTILLDEVTEIDLNLQAKLLRVLQEQTLERVGSSTTVQVDVRVLATSNRDLLEAVEAGNFRRDLYYRLNVVPLRVPPLRERPDDVPALVDHFLKQTAARLDREPCEVEPSAMQLLGEYHWPGNVRELENIVTRSSVLNLGGPIEADEIRPWLLESSHNASSSESSVSVGMSLHEMEKQLIEATVTSFEGHRAKAATALGIGVRTLSGKLKSYGHAPRAKDFSRAA